MACYKKIFIILSIVFCFFIFNNTKVHGADYTFGTQQTNVDYYTIQTKRVVDNITFNIFFNFNNTYTNNNYLIYTYFTPVTFTSGSGYRFSYSSYFYSNTWQPISYNSSATYTEINQVIKNSNSSYDSTYFASVNVAGSSQDGNYYTALNLDSVNNIYVYNNSTPSLYNQRFYDNNNRAHFPLVNLTASNIDIYGSTVSGYQTLPNENSTIIFNSTEIKNPIFFIASEDLQALNFDNLLIYSNSWDFNNNTNPYYFHILEYNYTVPDTTITYYNDRVFKLNELSKYYSENKFFSIPIDDLKLKNNRTYYFVLTSESSLSSGLPKPIMEITSDTIFDVVQIDTTDKISLQDTNQQINDNLNNMQQQNQEFQNNILDTNISSDTNNDIDTSLDYDNNNQDITNINNGFFSRLTTLVSNFADYDLNDVEEVSLPIPNSNQNLVLYSNTISANIPVPLLAFIQSFWWFIFSMYLYKFINKIYISISSGNVLNGFVNNDEVITNNML